MHLVNRVLRPFRLRLVRMGSQGIPSSKRRQILVDLQRRYGDRFDFVDSGTPLHIDAPPSTYPVNSSRLRVFRWLSYASKAIKKARPSKLLDVGSDVMWVTGVSAMTAEVSMVDIRDHPAKGYLPMSFSKASVLSLPFEDKTFDLVTAPQVIHHVGLTYGQDIDLDAPQKALREIARVLQPGGKLVLVTYVKSGRSLIALGNARIFGIAELRELLADHGFDIVDFQCVRGDSLDFIDENDVTDRPALAMGSNPHYYSDNAFVTAARRA